MRTAAILPILALAALPAHAGVISFAYNFNAPTLNANQTISNLTVGVTVQSSALGQNQMLADPTVATSLQPNPFVVPTPNCAKNPELCSQEPRTINGVDPKGKNPTDPQFTYESQAFSVTEGMAMNTNLKAAGIPNGTTVRPDAASLQWEPINNMPTFNAQKQLRFGATLNVQTAVYQPPNKGIGQAPPPRNVYALTATFNSATWVLSDGTKQSTAALAAHTVGLGQDAFALNGDSLPGLTFSYTNNAPSDVVLTDLVFYTTSDPDALNELFPVATFLTSALVTLDGVSQPSLTSYDVPAGDTLLFTFADTTDPYLVAEGDIFDESSDFEMGYAYEADVNLDEPPSLAMLALSCAALAFARRRRGRG